MTLNAPPPKYVHPAQVPKYVTISFETGPSYRFDTCEEAENYCKEILCAWDMLWDHQHFREIMATRAEERSWGEIEIDTDGSSRDFLFELERAGFISFGMHHDE